MKLRDLISCLSHIAFADQCTVTLFKQSDQDQKFTLEESDDGELLVKVSQEFVTAADGKQVYKWKAIGLDGFKFPEDILDDEDWTIEIEVSCEDEEQYKDWKPSQALLNSPSYQNKEEHFDVITEEASYALDAF